MSDTPKAPARDWRPTILMGLSIGLAVPTSQAVIRNLETTHGYPLALTLGLVAAGAVGGLVGLFNGLLPRPAAKAPSDGTAAA